MEIGDRITVFRDGRFVAAEPVSNVSIPWIIEKMVGKRASTLIIARQNKGMKC